MSLTLKNKEEAEHAIDTFFKAFDITCERSGGRKKGRVKKGGMDPELLKIFRKIGYESLPWLIFGGILIFEYLLSAYISSTPDNGMFQVMEQDYSLVNQTHVAIQNINSSGFLRMFNAIMDTGLISKLLTERGVQCSSPRAQAIINFMRLISSFYSGEANRIDFQNLMNIVTLTTVQAGLITGGLMKTVNHLRNTDFETLKQQALKFILRIEEPTEPHAPVRHGIGEDVLYADTNVLFSDNISRSTPPFIGAGKRRTKGRRSGKKRRSLHRRKTRRY
uniref:Uncharacterized protein n=1 Tax=viral metagenome TaxID=1070528 RepID=A0A6C0LE52_9ZZZZ